MPKIMYVCEVCEDESPEGCGYFDRKMLRVTNSGKWLCEGCWEESDEVGDIAFDQCPFIPPEYPAPREKTDRIYH